MRHKTLLFTFAAVLAFGLASCSKNEPATPTADVAYRASEAAKTEAVKAAEFAKVEAAKAAEAVQAEAARVADAAKAEAAKAAATAKVEAARVAEAAKAEAVRTADTAKTQGLIEKARSLIAEGNYSDASSVLEQLSGLSLSAEQKKLVDGLKEQIQKALAAKAAGGAGDLFKK